MIKQSIGDYYVFGTEFRYLLDASADMRVKGDGFIEENLVRFLRGLKELNLQVTDRAAVDLKDFHEELKLCGSNEKLDEERSKKLTDMMLELRTTLNAEIVGINAYITSPKRFSEEALLSNMPTLFMPGAFQAFPDIAKYDFSEAGKCIAFERPTAAAFHILRATEANLRHYYKSMIRKNRIVSQLWGPIVQDLRLKRKTKIHVALNNHLDNIRVSFRNPTQHPEATYDVHECQDLFSVCIDVNNRMFKIIATP